MTKEISLSNGLKTKVDDEDYEKLNMFNWVATVPNGKNKNYTPYARLNFKGKIYLMHRVIMGNPKGKQIDHIDGNGLNNCRANLKIVTPRENQQNQHREKSSVFPGVSFNKKTTKWVSHIKINGKSIYLGLFENELDAYHAYAKKCESLKTS